MKKKCGLTRPILKTYRRKKKRSRSNRKNVWVGRPLAKLYFKTTRSGTTFLGRKGRERKSGSSKIVGEGFLKVAENLRFLFHIRRQSVGKDREGGERG